MKNLFIGLLTLASLSAFASEGDGPVVFIGGWDRSNDIHADRFVGSYKVVQNEQCKDSRDVTITKAMKDDQGRNCDGLKFQEENAEAYYFCSINGPTRIETSGTSDIQVHINTTISLNVLQSIKTYPDFPEARERIAMTKNEDGSVILDYSDYVENDFSCPYTLKNN